MEKFKRSNYYYIHTFNYKDINIKVTIDSTFKINTHTNILDKNNLKNIHVHTSYEIFFNEFDSLDLMTMDGVLSFSEPVVIIPPFFKHFTLNCKNYRFLVDFSCNKSSAESYFKNLLSIFNSEKITALKTSNIINIYILELDKILKRNAIAKHDRITSILYLIFSEIFDNNNNRLLLEKTNESTNYVPIIDEIINSRISENIDLDYLSKELFLCKKQVSRIIKQVYGTKLSILIKEKKLSAAALLLEQTNMKIKEISETLYFSSEYYFNSLFKNKYGCAPLQYRKKHKKS